MFYNLIQHHIHKLVKEINYNFSFLISFFFIWFFSFFELGVEIVRFYDVVYCALE